MKAATPTGTLTKKIHDQLSAEVRIPPTEEQETAEDERVRADYPLKVPFGESQVDLNRRQRHVHDCDVQDDHELDDAQERQCQPLASIRSHHVVHFPFVRGGQACNL